MAEIPDLEYVDEFGATWDPEAGCIVLHSEGVADFWLSLAEFERVQLWLVEQGLK